MDGPRCETRAVALRGLRCATAPQGDGDRYALASRFSSFLKPDRHADMTARKAQPLVEALGVDAGVVGQKLDQLAAFGARFIDRPAHQLFADAAAAASAVDPDILDQRTRGALRVQARQDAELQAA